MTMMRKPLMLLILLSSLWLAQGALAVKVAVLPIEDLGTGVNGVDMQVTKLVAEDLKSMGIDVVPQDRIMDFLVSNRIRTVGYLSTYYVLRLREQLGADLVLVGSVCQKNRKAPVGLGLALNLIRTDDSRVVWSNAKGMSRADFVKLLGLDEPSSTQEIMAMLTRDVLATWPEDIEQAMVRMPIFQIESVSIWPKYVVPGQDVECRVRLRSTDDQRPEVFLDVKDIGKIPMTREGASGYVATWKAPLENGKYPIDLIMRWPSGRIKNAVLGSFSVDSTPPAVTLDLKGVRLGDSVAFRDRILAIPKLLHPEPVARWEISVENDQGDVYIREDGYGHLPDKFVWRGQTGGGNKVSPGIYKMVLKVWDKADNMAQCYQKVAVVTRPPVMTLQVRREGGDMIVDIGQEGKVPIAFWRVEMFSEDGRLLKTSEGDELPAKVGVSVPLQKDKKIECIVMLKDILGNSIRRKIKDLTVLAGRESSSGVAEVNQESWVTEF